MAKNTGGNIREGEIRGRRRFLNPSTDQWTKRDTETGEFISGKEDSALIKLTGVESDVLLIESSDVSRYKSGMQIKYWGEYYEKSPLRLDIP